MSRKSEIRDNKCLDCEDLIMRKSARCRSCSQSGKLSHRWDGGVKPCVECGSVRKFHSISPLCRNCFKGEKHFAWKGDDVGYVSLHTWVRSRLGKPEVCFFCGTTESKKFEWANISGLYHRDLNDYMSLCKSCHVKYDKKNNSIYKDKYE